MASTVGKLSATDRKQLCKITEGRFQILSNQLNQRQNEIQKLVRDKVLAEHETAIKDIRGELHELRIEEEALDLEHARKIKDLEYKKQKIKDRAADQGLTVRDSRYDKTTEVTPKNLDKSVREQTDVITKQFDVADTNLNSVKLNILENISVAGLESDQAKDFLGEIPSIDSLLPAPEDIPQLQELN